MREGLMIHAIFYILNTIKIQLLNKIQPSRSILMTPMAQSVLDNRNQWNILDSNRKSLNFNISIVIFCELIKRRNTTFFQFSA